MRSPVGAGRDRIRGFLLKVVVLTSVVLFTLSTAPIASAANLVPNPSFEDICGAVTSACFWLDHPPPVSPGNPFSAQRSTATARTGTASYRIGTLGYYGIGGDFCLTGIAPGKNYSFSTWYATTSTQATQVGVSVVFWANNCTTGLAQLAALANPPVRNGSWTHIGGTATAPATTQSASIYLVLDSSNGEAFYDDVLVEELLPTAVVMSTIRARRDGGHVLLEWRTASETHILGFNLYRRQRGTLKKLNRALIPSVFGGTATGHAYSWLDRGAPRGAARYRLQALSLGGKPSWVGAAEIAGP